MGDRWWEIGVEKMAMWMGEKGGAFVGERDDLRLDLSKIYNMTETLSVQTSRSEVTKICYMF